MDSGPQVTFLKGSKWTLNLPIKLKKYSAFHGVAAALPMRTGRCFKTPRCLTTMTSNRHKFLFSLGGFRPCVRNVYKGKTSHHISTHHFSTFESTVAAHRKNPRIFHLGNHQRERERERERERKKRKSGDSCSPPLLKSFPR